MEILRSYAPKNAPTFTGLITTAGQIKFPATQSASADLNTLDDYEEGTFTPSFSSTDLSVTYNAAVQRGIYVKIGRIVTASLYVQVTAVSGTTSNVLKIAGLPFASEPNYEYGFSCSIGVHQFTLEPSIFLKKNDTVMDIYQRGTVTALTGAALQVGFYLATITYSTT